MTEDQAFDIIMANPGIGRIKLSNITGLSETKCRRLLNKHKDTNMTIDKPNLPDILHGAVKADKFIKQHDVVQVVRNLLPKLKGYIIAESDFRKNIQGFDSVRIARAFNLPEFRTYRKRYKDRWYWGWPEEIKNWEEILSVEYKEGFEDE